jgi:hypothetical protein
MGTDPCCGTILWGDHDASWSQRGPDRASGEELMNQIIYIVGLIVIVVFILGYFGLR